MALVTLLEDPRETAVRLAWSRRLASVVGVEQIVFCLLDGDEGESIERLRPDTESAHPLVASVRESEDVEEAARVYLLRKAEPAHVLEQLIERKAGWVVAGRSDGELARLLFETRGFNALLLEADEAPEDDLAVAVTALDGPHTRHALELANQLSVRPPIIFELEDSVEDRCEARPLAGVVKDREPEIASLAGATLLEALTAAETPHMVLVGHDNPVTARRLLARRAGAGGAHPALAVLRGPGARSEQTRDAFVRALRRVVPRLEREYRKKLDDTVAERSDLQLDFVVLIVFSTAIAGLGLLKDSGAVVIGAMLVAPLMTPMIGAGLALVHGNTVLGRRALLAVIVGFLISCFVSLLLGLIVRPDSATHEMLLRGGSPPDLGDLAIALLSGFAAAWASARPGLVGAIAGVAIAAALVPPIATVGLSTQAALAGAYTGAWEHAVHAATLFVVNLVAIIFASALALLVLGMRPAHRDNRVPDWQAWGFAVVVLLAALMVVLTG